MNNYRHGRRTKTLVLPWEDRQTYEEGLATWIAEQGAETRAEIRMITSAL
jgi:hypothetical protein